MDYSQTLNTTFPKPDISQNIALTHYAGKYFHAHEFLLYIFFVYGCKIYAACIDFISLLSGQKFSTSVLPDVNNHLLSWELGNHT